MPSPSPSHTRAHGLMPPENIKNRLYSLHLSIINLIHNCRSISVFINTQVTSCEIVNNQNMNNNTQSKRFRWASMIIADFSLLSLIMGASTAKNLSPLFMYNHRYSSIILYIKSAKKWNIFFRCMLCIISDDLYL